MTIRLFDIQEQKRYRDELETHSLRVQAAMDTPGSPWPQCPEPPKPMVDSMENRESISLMATPVTGRAGDGPSWYVPRDSDGTSQTEVRGFESRWTCDDEAPAKPFKTK